MLNELTQQGRIETVAWTVESTGPSHAPAFTATAATRLLTMNTPVHGQGSGASKLRAALKRAGRVRHVDQDVERLHAIFRAEHMRLPDLMGHQLTALPGQVEENPEYCIGTARYPYLRMCSVISCAVGSGASSEIQWPIPSNATNW
ncbi:hypothetical protein GCM10009525_47300 [Streptosporangium amethystogenes subsp. fukuiense]